MTRQLALGLLALALALAPSRAATADEPKAEAGHAPTVSAASHSGPAATTPATATQTQDAGHAAPAGEAGHGASASSQPNILEVQAPLAIWTVVVFGVLLLILGRFAWKPLMKAMHDREEHIEQTLLATERARNEAERLHAENQKNLAHAQEQVRAMLAEARKGAEESAALIVQKAQAEAEASRERAEREIGVAKDQALGEIFGKTADLAVAVAGKVLGRTLDESDHRRLVDSAMAELPAMAGNGEARRA